MRRFGEYVRMSKSKHVLAVFDSCFSGTIFDAQRTKPPPVITRATTYPVRQFITSGDADQAVSDDGKFRKIFLRALNGEEIKADANGDTYLTGSELGLFMDSRISNLTNNRQTPKSGKIKDEDYDRGDFVFLLAGGDPDPDKEEKKSKGKIHVKSDPSGADIFLNNRFIGISPVKLSDIETGTYTIKARLKDYSVLEKNVKVKNGRTSYANFTFNKPEPVNKKGKLYVSTQPSDVKVRIMNISDKFFNGIELESGDYKLEISKQGYETRTEWVEIQKGEILDYQVVLKKKKEKLKSGQVRKEPITGMEFVRVQGGCFDMGSNEGGSDEKPVHKVCLDGYWIGKYEVTQGQWKDIMGNNPSNFSSCGDKCPVEKVSWNDAKNFIKKLNKRSTANKGVFRLPTEAQWEYAARSRGKNHKYSGGNNIDLLLQSITSLNVYIFATF